MIRLRVRGAIPEPVKGSRRRSPSALLRFKKTSTQLDESQKRLLRPDEYLTLPSVATAPNPLAAEPKRRQLQSRHEPVAAQRQRELGNMSPVVNVQFYAPAGSWLPTELGERVLNELLEAGCDFKS
jgi:hypothetical protein